MQCISPIKAGFDQAGDITYTKTKFSQELATFAFPCRKCLPCRLNTAREKAIRAYHEAQMHEDNIFLTLTFDDDHIGNNRLNYLDYQLFQKRLLEYVNRDVKHKENRINIPFMVTGEYGSETKRQHYHALLFNFRPSDEKYQFSTDRKDKLYTSETIQKLWPFGTHYYGELTLDSASYVARYGAKKLTHGKDQDHDFHPIHRVSTKHALGKSWIEKYWQQTFSNGYIVLPNKEKAAIPRYYQDWLKKHHPEAWMEYQDSEVRKQTIQRSEKIKRQEEMEHFSNLINYSGNSKFPLTRPQVKERILQTKFKKLQENLKL